MHNYERWVERILSQLRRDLDGQRIEVKEGWEERLEHVARRIADDTYMAIQIPPRGWCCVPAYGNSKFNMKSLKTKWRPQRHPLLMN